MVEVFMIDPEPIGDMTDHGTWNICRPILKISTVISTGNLRI